jgi:hypothetical protein
MVASLLVVFVVDGEHLRLTGGSLADGALTTLVLVDGPVVLFRDPVILLGPIGVSLLSNHRPALTKVFPAPDLLVVRTRLAVRLSRERQP